MWLHIFRIADVDKCCTKLPPPKKITIIFLKSTCETQKDKIQGGYDHEHDGFRKVMFLLFFLKHSDFSFH